MLPQTSLDDRMKPRSMTAELMDAEKARPISVRHHGVRVIFSDLLGTIILWKMSWLELEVPTGSQSQDGVDEDYVVISLTLRMLRDAKRRASGRFEISWTG